MDIVDNKTVILSKKIASIINTYRIEHDSEPKTVTDFSKILKAKGCPYYIVTPRYLADAGFLLIHDSASLRPKYIFATDKPIHWRVFEAMIKKDREKGKKIMPLNNNHLEPDFEKMYLDIRFERNEMMKHIEDVYGNLFPSVQALTVDEIVDMLSRTQGDNDRRILHEAYRLLNIVWHCIEYMQNNILRK